MAQSNYSTVCPFLTVKEIETEIVFLVKVFKVFYYKVMLTSDDLKKIGEVVNESVVANLESIRQDISGMKGISQA